MIFYYHFVDNFQLKFCIFILPFSTFLVYHKQYSGFSKVYDDLVSDTNKIYADKLVEFIIDSNLNVKNIYELACGTGNIALNLANRGFNVTASDISESMISIANYKNKQVSNKCAFMQKDMRQVQSVEKYDMVSI
jgi:2-polyprenyl-3-methyl-5-hydroxy-6-metoxy-1,4-benzoquinol methylase